MAARAAACLGALSAVLFGVRLFAATRLGFGDSEALYASYALHPQPEYLDHPGMVGLFARAIGGGTAPSALRAHLVTSVLATAVPWVIAVLCRVAGAAWARSLWTAAVVALVPEIAIGLFAMTPDLLLCLFWSGCLALAAIALRAPPGGTRALFAFAGAGLLAGAAGASKVTGILLFPAVAAAIGAREDRAHARTVAPWAGLSAGLLVLFPIVAFEARSGWPMLTHRLSETQGQAGVSLRNLGALVAGQLAYLSPLVAVLAVVGARAAYRDRGDAVGTLLFAAFALPLAILVPLSLWSRVAEPHWIGPALLSLAPAMARTVPHARAKREFGPASTGPQARRLVIAAAALGGAFDAAVHAWVLVPGALRLAPASYDARLDIANELYGWPEVLRAVREEVAAQASPGLEDVAVVGPHWVICVQLEAELKGDVHVGCNTSITDDFDRWWPRQRWHAAESIVWVTDQRFPQAPDLPLHAPLHVREVAIERDGRVVRRFVIASFGRRAEG
jgi:hypothetical protein